MLKKLKDLSIEAGSFAQTIDLKFSKKLWLLVLVVNFAFLALPFVVNAQQPPANSLVPVELGRTSNIIAVIRGIIRFILLVAFIIAFVMLIIGGLRWILAGGDEKKVEGARNTITAALIGLVIILITFALIRVVEVFFNVTIISGQVGIPSLGETQDDAPPSSPIP